MTTTNWQSQFQQWLTEGKRSPSTIASYSRDLSVFERWFQAENLDPFSPNLLTSTDLRAFRQHSLAVEKCMPATWNRRRATLSLLAEWAKQQDLIQGDPLNGVSGAEQSPVAPRWLDDAEFRRVMRQLEINRNAANTPLRKEQAVRDMAIIHLMVFAGLRVSEVCALQRGDIEIGERSGRVIIRLGKGQKYGEVPLAAEVRKSLAEWLEICHEEAIFTVSSREVQKLVSGMGAQLKIKDLTPHRFRHTFVKRMLDAGKTGPTVQTLARHRSFSTTAHYGVPGVQDMQAAVESILAG